MRHTIFEYKLAGAVVPLRTFDSAEHAQSELQRLRKLHPERMFQIHSK